SESTFGDLKTSTADEGSFAWTVPLTLPNGTRPLEGRPLHFTLTVTQSNPDETLTRNLDGWIGQGPQIIDLSAPAAVSEQTTSGLSWKVATAARVQVFINGGLAFEPLPGSPSIADGFLSQAPLSADVDYELVAWSGVGARASQKKHVHLVKPPVVSAFQ